MEAEGAGVGGVGGEELKGRFQVKEKEISAEKDPQGCAPQQTNISHCS
jgi:hypothetical protein